jgi:hypothetical protein
MYSHSAGGETIKQINQQTGAHCELDRRPPPNPAEKVFVIRGSPDQIEQAKRIISEKIGMVSNKHIVLVMKCMHFIQMRCVEISDEIDQAESVSERNRICV